MEDNLAIESDLALVDAKILVRKINFYPGETVWHSNWKNAFQETYREKTFLNKAVGYCHRADVFTACGYCHRISKFAD